MSFQYIKHQCGTSTDFLPTGACLEGYRHSIIFHQIKKKTCESFTIFFTEPLFFSIFFCACTSLEVENIFSKDEMKINLVLNSTNIFWKEGLHTLLEQNVQEVLFSVASHEQRWQCRASRRTTGGQPYVDHKETTAATLPKGLRLPEQGPW